MAGTEEVNCTRLIKALNVPQILQAINPITLQEAAIDVTKRVQSIFFHNLYPYIYFILGNIIPGDLKRPNITLLNTELSKVVTNVIVIEGPAVINDSYTRNIWQQVIVYFTGKFDEVAFRLCKDTDFRAALESVNVTMVREAMHTPLEGHGDWGMTSLHMTLFIVGIFVVGLLLCRGIHSYLERRKVPGSSKKYLLFVDHITDRSNFRELSATLGRWQDQVAQSLVKRGIQWISERVNRATTEQQLATLPLLLPCFMASRVGEDIKRPMELVKAKVPRTHQPDMTPPNILVLFHHHAGHLSPITPTRGRMQLPGWTIVDVCYDDSGLYPCAANKETTVTITDILAEAAV